MNHVRGLALALVRPVAMVVVAVVLILVLLPALLAAQAATPI